MDGLFGFTCNSGAQKIGHDECTFASWMLHLGLLEPVVSSAWAVCQLPHVGTVPRSSYGARVLPEVGGDRRWLNYVSNNAHGSTPWLHCRWEPGSYGYHGDDGKKFIGTGSGEGEAAGAGGVRYPQGAEWHLTRQT